MGLSGQALLMNGNICSVYGLFLPERHRLFSFLRASPEGYRGLTGGDLAVMAGREAQSFGANGGVFGEGSMFAAAAHRPTQQTG